MKFSAENALAVVYGHKCSTARLEKKAEPGDEFPLGGFRYRVLDVMPMPAHRIIGEFHRCEGFTSPVECWNGLQAVYPDTSPDATLWMHFFARLP